MTSRQKLLAIPALVSFSLLIILFIKLAKTSGFMLSPVLVAGMMATALLVSSGLVSGVLSLIIKRGSFYIIFYAVLIISTTATLLHFHSPTLKITVPKGYTGPITLVLSRVSENILATDRYGIAYINEYTFDHVYTPPDVVETDGSAVNPRCVGFSPSIFWGKGYYCCFMGREIKTLSFEIAPENKQGQNQYYDRDITCHLDSSIVLTFGPVKQTTVPMPVSRQ